MYSFIYFFLYVCVFVYMHPEVTVQPVVVTCKCSIILMYRYTVVISYTILETAFL